MRATGFPAAERPADSATQRFDHNDRLSISLMRNAEAHPAVIRKR
jgi:hypothetical protein